MFRDRLDPTNLQIVVRLTTLYVAYYFYKKTKKDGEPTWKAIGYAIGWSTLAGIGLSVWLVI